MAILLCPNCNQKIPVSESMIQEWHLDILYEKKKAAILEHLEFRRARGRKLDILGRWAWAATLLAVAASVLLFILRNSLDPPMAVSLLAISILAFVLLVELIKMKKTLFYNWKARRSEKS